VIIIDDTEDIYTFGERKQPLKAPISVYQEVQMKISCENFLRLTGSVPNPSSGIERGCDTVDIQVFELKGGMVMLDVNDINDTTLFACFLPSAFSLPRNIFRLFIRPKALVF